MSRNKRKLDRVLRVREVEEDVARGIWASAEAAAASARNATEALLREHELSQESLRLQLEGGQVSPRAVICAQQAIETIGGRIERARQAERAAAARAEQARIPWEQKRRAKRGLEILVDRARQAELEEIRALEAATLDEVAIQRAARKQPDPRKNSA